MNLTKALSALKELVDFKVNVLKMNGASNASPSILNSSSDGGHSSFDRQQSSLNRSFGAVIGLGN